MRIGKKRRFHSPLDDVKGLGDRAKKALLTHVGNLAAIRAADDATLLAVPGVSARHVRALRAVFHPHPPRQRRSPKANRVDRSLPRRQPVPRVKVTARGLLLGRGWWGKPERFPALLPRLPGATW